MASEFKHTEAFVRKYGEDVVQEMRNRLVTHGKVSSGKLFDSLRFEVKTNPDIKLTFKMADHGKFVDKGVSGAGIPEGFGGKKKKVERSKLYSFRDKMPPIKPIRDWVKIQGLPKGTEFPIRRSIWIFGIAPTNFFTIPTTRRQKQFEKGIEKNMGKDFEEILKKGFK
jgi:hypothetical protein